MPSFNCPAPWTNGHFTFKEQGICCEYQPTPGTSPVAFLNGPVVKDIKQRLISGDITDGCLRCQQQEQNGFHSLRQRLTDTAIKLDSNWQFDADQPSLPDHVEIRFGNLCNFKCRMCVPAWSNLIGHEIQQTPKLARWYGNGDNYRHDADDEFVDDLKQLLPGFKKIYITGGEPMVSKQAMDFIDHAINQNYAAGIELQFATNVSVINPGFLKRLASFRRVSIILSIDAVGAIAEYQRHGTVWPVVHANILAYMEYAKEHKNIDINFHVALTAYSVQCIDQLMEYYLDLLKTYGRLGIAITIVSEYQLLSPRHLIGPLREQAEQRLQKAISLLEEFLYRRWVPHVTEQKAQLQNLLKLLQTSNANPADWQRFCEFTQETDAVRNESFSKTFGISLT
jgi:sulfatase maturation enzyme AslB (radical SAM superfamily)